MGDCTSILKPKDGDVYVNVPRSSIDGGKRVYCPLCYYDLREVPMVFDHIAKIWTCNYCKYQMQHHQNPVDEVKISAGNDIETSVPYMRAVSFRKKAPNVARNEVFSNAAQAFQSD
jgi:hypothetical protein